MRVPLSWLGEYVDVDLEPERLSEQLTLLGMEVKGIEQRGADWRNVVVGELLAVEKHPRADRLSLVRVTVGSGEPIEIVCGATNIAPGQRVPVALPGAVLPGDRRIERTEKMGVVSNGMLCSGDELQLTGDADGILILPPETSLGSPLVELYGDVVLDVDVKPNRGDALSIVGLGREISIITGAPVRWPATDVVESGPTVGERLSVEVQDTHLCPRFVGRWVSGVAIGPSPHLVQSRLIAAGMRPVSNVVDASNYVMLELGKPIHTFDAAAIHDGRLVVRRATPDERMETLDHVERSLTDDTLVIADANGPIGIAGVMGGRASEIDVGTTDVVIESAIFDPVSIRRTGQRYGLRSEASLRFEKGQEIRLARIGADRCARLILEWAGGSLLAGSIDSAPDEPAEREVAFRPARVVRLLGLELGVDEQRAVLARAGVSTWLGTAGTTIQIAAGADPLEVQADAHATIVAIVPTWRRDLAIEADIVEEIARVRGYETIPPTLPETAPPPWRPSPLEVRDAVRETLVGAGIVEVVSHALVSPRLLERFSWVGPDEAAAGEIAAGGGTITVLNPLSPDHSVMRQGLIGSLVEVVSGNARHGRTDLALFEVGKGYGRDGETAREWWRVGFALAGAAEPAAWSRTARPSDLDDAKGIVELLAGRLRLGRAFWTRLVDEPILHPGRSARVDARRADGTLGLTGRIGEVNPSQIERWDLRVDRLIVAELSIAGLSGGQLPVIRAVPVGRHPVVERDLAIVVPAAVEAAAVDAAIRRSAGPLLVDVRLFDVYRGAPLTATEKSLAERLVFRAADRTLTDEEIEGAIARITTSLAEELGARLRT